MIMYMNFQFAAARKHKFLLIHGQRSKEDQRWRLNKSRVERYISYQDLPGSSDWSDNIGGFPYRFHHHWILMNFVLGQHGGRSKLSLATGPQIVHLLETIICSDWSKDANRMYLYSLTTAGTVLCRNTTYHAYFWHSSCCIWSFRSRTYIQCFFFSSAGYLATSSLYSFVVLNWPQALLILKCHRSLQLWGWLQSTSKKQFFFTGIWCTQVLCVIVLENIPINKQIYVWTYNWARHISWFPVAVPWGLACFAPDTSDLSPWRWIFLILAFPREMLYPKNRSWIPWIHCALLKHTWRLWVYTSPTTTCFFQYAIWRLDIRLHQNVRSCTVRPLTTPRSSDKA